MRIGIGLPAAIPGTPATAVAEWAGESERLGFRSLSVLDRLVYDNLDPLVALAAAAARTGRVELLTTVLNVPYRRNAVMLAKQLASIDALSGGRLTPGLALGGWPEDYAASEAPTNGRGATFEAMLATMRRVWAGEVTGAAGPMPATPDGRPPVLLGGVVPAAFGRVAAVGDGWISPFFGYDVLVSGMASVRQAWGDAGRAGEPRFVTARYFCLGERADRIAHDYVQHYYGQEWAAFALAETLTTPSRLRDEIGRVSDAGCDDLLLFPCTGELEQLALLAAALPLQVR